MNNLIVPFEYEGRQVRTVQVDGEPWFVLADVCKILDLGNPSRVADRIDAESLTTSEVLDARGVSHPTNVVSEAGLYEVIFLSRKPEAKRFKHWVTHEVLPTIRKTGQYGSPQLSETEIVAQALRITSRKVEELEAARAIDAPKILFANSVTAAHTTILVGDLAKIIRQNGVEIGGTRLFEELRTRGFLIKRRGADWNMPTQRSMEMGLFEIKETAVTHSDGHVTVNKTPKVTGKGQQYFVNLFLNKEQAVA